MKILISNDDGIMSRGLQILKNILKQKHEVWVVAPNKERSAVSHGISIKKALKVAQLDDKEFSCSGSPADCILLGLNGLIGSEPDMVISGINIGPNLGTDIIYSGTVAAARQAALMGIPGLALSVTCFKEPFYFENASYFVLKNIELFKNLWDEKHLLNINFPSIMKYNGIEIAEPAERAYDDYLEKHKMNSRESFYFIKNSEIITKGHANTDFEVINKGCISISPVAINPVLSDTFKKYLKVEFQE